MKEVDYADFIDKISEINVRKPLYGLIELTYRCSYSCIHCYCKNQPKEELSSSFWKNLLGQIYDLGGIELTFTGGEPLLYKSFLEVYQHAKKKGFLINIFTSGYNLNREVLNFLEESPPLNIEITLNSLDKKNYERITWTNGIFDTVMKNIYEIKKVNLPLAIKCSGLKENKDEILKIKEFTEKLLGKKKFKFDSFIFPGLNREREPTQHRLSAKEIIEIETQDKDMSNQKKKQLGEQCYCFNPEGIYHCNSWFTHYYINPQGILQFCHLTKKYSTDLKKEPLKGGFDKFLDVLNEKYKTNSRCVSCEYKEYCYHCPARAYLEVGDQESPVEYYCQLAKARQEQRQKWQ